MKFITFGINHKSAPVNIRDKVAIAPDLVHEKIRELIDGEVLREGVLLSTCNRTEIFAFTESTDQAKVHCQNFFHHLYQSKSHDGPDECLHPYLHFYLDNEAVQYLYTIISGLDSLALGETQISGQVREAYDISRMANLSGVYCSRLFEKAFHLNKRVRSETKIGERSTSISSLSIQLAKNRFKDLSKIKALLIGAGKMSEICLQLLIKENVSEVQIANHNLCNSSRLAKEYNQKVLPWVNLSQGLLEADLVITSTAAPHPILRYDLMAEVASIRDGRHLKIIDIAMPRDVEPNVGEFDHINLYNIDDLESMGLQLTEELSAEIEKAKVIIEEEADDFEDWAKSLDSKSIIMDLHDTFEQQRSVELNRLKNKVKNINEEDWEEIIQFSSRLMNKYLHNPTHSLRNPNGTHPAMMIESVRKIFKLEK